MTTIILSTVIVAVVGLFIGFFLGFAGKKFAVEVDPREEAILDVLPGNNCGGCGYAGCSGLACAIVKGEAEIGACPVGGDPVAAKIGEIMGMEAGASVRTTAFVMCAGSCENASDKYNYYGVQDCAMVANVPGGGAKQCAYGCLGFGNCVKACPFDAIHVVDGIAYVDKDACKSCGKCVAACPKHLIEIIPYDSKHQVQCASKDKGKDVMAGCKVGCIGCKLCEKACEDDAIHVVDNIAHIDYEKCTNCGKCVAACKARHIIL